MSAPSTSHSPPDPGHVFVVNGSLENLRADAKLVPTDRSFHVMRSWERLTGSHPSDLQPADWPNQRSGSAPDRSDLWFLDVARTDIRELTDALADVVRAMAASLTARPLTSARSRPLIAVPSVGGRAGGFSRRRGALITAILDTLQQVTRETEVDVAIVARDVATFSAYQASRRQRARTSGQPFGQDGSWQRELGKRVREGEVALFLGAGVSMSAGLPSWPELIGELKKLAGATDIDLSGLSPLDQAQFLANRLDGRLGSSVVQILEAANKDHLIGLSHVLLAGFRCREAVTTNFDDLYERAVEDSGGQRPESVPTGRRGRGPWVLKLHGDLQQPERIVLSREQFVRFAGGSVARGAVLQSLMLTRHLLVVGASFSDDNLLRLLFEVKQLADRSTHHQIGTVLTVVPDKARQAIFSGDFDFRSVTQQEKVDSAATRALEIELDRIGMFACLDATYLASPDFTGMLNDEEQAIAQQIRALAESIDGLTAADRHVDGWRLVRDALERFGIAPPRRELAPGAARQRTSLTEIRAEAMAAVMDELSERGATVRQTDGSDRSVDISVDPANSRGRLAIKVRSKLGGAVWQTSTTHGRPRLEPETPEARFRVLVDLRGDSPTHYVVPEWWIQNDIHTAHAAFLAQNGGERPRTVESTHHGITDSRVAQWRDRWDLLGLERLPRG